MTDDGRDVPPLVGLLLRLYPSWWRPRYAGELTEVLVAALADGRPRSRLVYDVVLGAFDAHVHPSLTGGHLSMADLRRPTCRSVYAFIAFVVAGAGFQKMTEDQPFTSAARAHPLIGWSYLSVVAGAVVAGIAVLAGGLPVAFHVVRQAVSGRRDLMRHLVAPPVAVALFVTVTAGLARISGSDTAAHAGASRGVFALVACLGLAVAMVCASSAAAVVRRADLPTRLLRYQVVPMAVLSLAMTLAAVAVVVWGLALRSSDAVLFHAHDGLASSATPLSWASAVAGMAIATAVAGHATVRALTTLREPPSQAAG